MISLAFAMCISYKAPMSRELTPQEAAERSLIKKYRKELWNPFIAAVKRYGYCEKIQSDCCRDEGRVKPQIAGICFLYR